MTPASHERLALLLEELGEAQQTIGKILRHGWESTDPTFTTPGTNRQQLANEMGDVAAAVELLTRSMDVPEEHIKANKRGKLKRVRKYLHEPQNQELATEALAQPLEVQREARALPSPAAGAEPGRTE